MTQEDIIKCYEAVFINHAIVDIPILFNDFKRFIEMEETTEAEMSDLEYICDRVDMWIECMEDEA